MCEFYQKFGSFLQTFVWPLGNSETCSHWSTSQGLAKLQIFTTSMLKMSATPTCSTGFVVFFRLTVQFLFAEKCSGQDFQSFWVFSKFPPTENGRTKSAKPKKGGGNDFIDQLFGVNQNITRFKVYHMLGGGFNRIEKYGSNWIIFAGAWKLKKMKKWNHHLV